MNRKNLVETLRAFAEARDFSVNWKSVTEAADEELVNALAMLSPYGAKEKQALLEASDIPARAELLIALTEVELARSGDAPRTQLQ